MEVKLKAGNKFSKRKILAGSDCVAPDNVLEVIDSEGKVAGWIRETGELHYENRESALIVLSEA